LPCVAELLQVSITDVELVYDHTPAEGVPIRVVLQLQSASARTSDADPNSTSPRAGDATTADKTIKVDGFKITAFSTVAGVTLDSPPLLDVPNTSITVKFGRSEVTSLEPLASTGLSDNTPDLTLRGCPKLNPRVRFGLGLPVAD
jgi:hypothetical protein